MGCGKSKIDVIETSNKTDPNPPIKPPRKKKKDAVPPPESFAAIDEHALKAPSSVRSSVSSLAQYLVKPARNDMEKLRAIYRWIADNISYDTSGFFNGNFGPQTSEAVLQRGSSVCEGYATLFDVLCKEIGIPCKKVSGFSKGFGYDLENPFTINTNTDHAWNIVFINGEWRPIESTWGAGHLNSNNEYEKDFKEFYFLTDPEDFVLAHFPYVDKGLSTSLPLQLLKQPVSLEKFNTAICPTTKGIEWRFDSISHNIQVITVDKECEITFRTRNVDLQDVICHLVERNTKTDNKQYVLLRRIGKNFSVKVTPPTEGKYDLELYGKPVNSTTSTYDMLISFVIRCQSILKDIRPYPDTSGVWGANPDAKRYGFTNDIFRYDVISTKTGELKIKLETERQVAVSLELSQSAKGSVLERFVFDYYDGNNLVIMARFPTAGFYKLTLHAEDPEKETTAVKETTEFDHVADFLIDNKRSMTGTKPFPEMSTASQIYGCHLIEPLIGDLLANDDVHLRLRSAQLLSVMVNKQVHEKGRNDEFDISFKTPDSGTTVSVYGSPNTEGSLHELYVFTVI